MRVTEFKTLRNIGMQKTQQAVVSSNQQIADNRKLQQYGNSSSSTVAAAPPQQYTSSRQVPVAVWTEMDAGNVRPPNLQSGEAGPVLDCA